MVKGGQWQRPGLGRRGSLCGLKVGPEPEWGGRGQEKRQGNSGVAERPLGLEFGWHVRVLEPFPRAYTPALGPIAPRGLWSCPAVPLAGRGGGGVLVLGYAHLVHPALFSSLSSCLLLFFFLLPRRLPPFRRPFCLSFPPCHAGQSRGGGEALRALSTDGLCGSPSPFPGAFAGPSCLHWSCSAVPWSGRGGGGVGPGLCPPSPLGAIP